MQVIETDTVNSGQFYTSIESISLDIKTTTKVILMVKQKEE